MSTKEKKPLVKRVYMVEVDAEPPRLIEAVSRDAAIVYATQGIVKCKAANTADVLKAVKAGADVEVAKKD